MIRVHHIGTTTVQGPAYDMPQPFDPATHIPPQQRAADGQEAGFPPEGGRAARSPSAAGYIEATGHLQNAKYAATNPDRAQIAALAASAAPDPDTNADCCQPIDPAAMVERLRDTGKWLASEDVAAAADLIEALVAECSREFARGYETGRAVGAVEGKA